MKPTTSRPIVISLGDLGSTDHGLGEFAVQIGTRIAAQAQIWRERYGLQFYFHLRRSMVGLFGEDVGYLPVSRWHRYRHSLRHPCALWHSLHQLNKNMPPAMEPGGRRVVTVHDLNYLYGRNAWSTWRHGRRTKALMRRTDVLVAISQHTAADVRRHLGWTGPLEVIYNGARSFVDAPRIPLSGWAGDDTRPFLFHLSRMSSSKNPQVLIELARHWPEMTFVLCGPQGKDARALEAAHRLPNLQFHLGITEAQKAWAYAHCTGFLFPSLTEGFGLPPIEAMHFGKPVFLARRTCLPEIGGDAADYFDDFEPCAMQRVVETGLARQAEPDRPEAIQAHAAQFNWDHAAADYLALYGRLLHLPAT